MTLLNPPKSHVKPVVLAPALAPPEPCHNCGAPLPERREYDIHTMRFGGRGGGRNRKFCSNACRQARYRRLKKLGLSEEEYELRQLQEMTKLKT